jgi:methionyl-tRNA formyltransferase
MDAGMDTGDMIDTLSFPIPFQRTVIELIKALEQKGPKFLNTTLRNLGKRLITPIEQQESEATYCQKIEKSDGEIDPFKDTLENMYAKYRAFTLRPKIRFILNEKTVIIEKLILDEKKRTDHKETPLLEVKGKEKLLNPAITEILLKPEGKKAMEWKSFLNGYLNTIN